MDDKNLTIYNNELYDMIGGKPSNRRFHIPEIKLISKLGYQVNHNKTVSFVFKLSSHTDPDWRNIFHRHFEKDITDFSGDEITIVAKPEELENKIKSLKDALRLTNHEYKKLSIEAREKLERKIADEKTLKISQEQARIETEQKAKDIFNNLTI